ncbi:ribosomal protein S7 domain-containing protein [Podospora conica]|nr:ribosomal protein S7 domain-containing protein [Schizothecium conicum]
MPPRLNIWSARRALPVRSRPLAQWPPQPCVAAAQARPFSDNLQNTTPSDPDESPSHPALARFGQTQAIKISDNEKALERLRQASYGLNPYDPAVEGHKYGMPEIGPHMNHKDRYGTVVSQVTKMLMRDGKLAKAQRDMAIILNHLRSSPPPKIKAQRPLIPGSPEPEQLPLDPAVYLEVAIDSVAPLIRIRGFRNLGGGGRSLEVPVPIPVRKRRRAAIGWILDAVDRRASNIDFTPPPFPVRVAEEIIAVVEGRSSVWEKRMQLHKLATATRANLNSFKLKNFTIA